MKSLKQVGAAALFSAASYSAALAADLPSRIAPPPPPPPLPMIAGWDGLYVGSTYGYGFTNFKTSQASSRSKSESGQTGGALIGYNFQSGHFVYGAEAGIDLNVIRGNVPGQAGTLAASRLDTMDDIRFRGRLGYEFGWFMPFIAGGAVINETYQSTPNPANYFGQDKRSVGWTVGAGVDVKINPHQIMSFLPESLFGPLIVRLEYLHDSLPRETFTLGAGAGVQTFRTESSSNIGRVALIYRFGDNPPRPYADTLGNVNWGGGYGGVFGGYDSVSTKSRLTGFGNTKGSADGGFGGIYAGSNFMFFNNRLMLGIEGSTSIADITGNESLPGAPSYRASFREFVKADLRGRIGYAFGRFLPFAAAGIDFTRNEQRDISTGSGSQVGRVPVDNFTFGGGVDYRVSERVSVRAEYLRDESINRSTVRLNGTNTKQDYSSDAFRFGAAYHFE